MINLAQQKQDAANAAINALSTQHPGETLLKRLRALAAHNPDVSGVITFVERAVKVEQQLAETQRKLKDAQMFDMRHAGVPHHMAPSLDHSNSIGTPSGEGLTDQEKWAEYHKLMKTDPAGAARFRRQNLPSVSR